MEMYLYVIIKLFKMHLLLWFQQKTQNILNYIYYIITGLPIWGDSLIVMLSRTKLSHNKSINLLSNLSY